MADEPIREAITEFVKRFSRRGLPRLQDWLEKKGHAINHKRTARIYREMGMQVRKRKRKRLGRLPKVVRPVPSRPNEVWSMDFVFDRVASGRTLKCLVVVDDATHEAVSIVVEHSMGGNQLTRVLDQLCSLRGRPIVIRSDNGPEFIGKAMLTWAHRCGVTLRTIEPGKPNQNAYVESFNCRLRDECLNEHWFTSITHARTVIEAWRREYNEERPKRVLGGRTPTEYAKHLAIKAITMPGKL